MLNAKMVIKLGVKSPAKETRRGCEEQGVCAEGITGSTRVFSDSPGLSLLELLGA